MPFLHATNSSKPPLFETFRSNVSFRNVFPPEVWRGHLSKGLLGIVQSMRQSSVTCSLWRLGASCSLHWKMTTWKYSSSGGCSIRRHQEKVLDNRVWRLSSLGLSELSTHSINSSMQLTFLMYQCIASRTHLAFKASKYSPSSPSAQGLALVIPRW